MQTARFTRSASGCDRGAKDGFTLVEMSVVLTIIGLIILIVFPALQAMRQSMQQEATQRHLDALLRASAAFVQANGCVPCPTPSSASGPGFGRVRGDGSGVACGLCLVAEGIAPFASLGLPATVARDGWGHWITMRTDPALAINFGVVPPTSPCLSGDPSPCPLGTSSKGLCRSTLTPGASSVRMQRPGNVFAQYAAILFLSHGPNGWGAFRADPAAPPTTNAHPSYGGPVGTCGATTGLEVCNANGDTTFVTADRVDDPNDPFDDMMVYMGRNALVSLLGNGACQTAWE